MAESMVEAAARAEMQQLAGLALRKSRRLLRRAFRQRQQSPPDALWWTALEQHLSPVGQQQHLLLLLR